MAKTPPAVNGRIAKCLIVNRDSHILLLTIGDYTKHPQLSYLPDLPGGIIEDSESVGDGMVREKLLRKRASWSTRNIWCAPSARLYRFSG